MSGMDWMMGRDMLAMPAMPRGDVGDVAVGEVAMLAVVMGGGLADSCGAAPLAVAAAGSCSGDAVMADGSVYRGTGCARLSRSQEGVCRSVGVVAWVCRWVVLAGWGGAAAAVRSFGARRKSVRWIVLLVCPGVGSQSDSMAGSARGTVDS